MPKFDVFAQDGTFSAAGCASESEVTAIALRQRFAIASVQKFIDSCKDKFTTNKVLAFFPNELLIFTWVGSGIDEGW
jgi:hypothetical protein